MLDLPSLPKYHQFRIIGKIFEIFFNRRKTSTYIEAFFKEDPKIISAYINENEKTRRKQKTGRFLQSVFAWNTFPLGATAPLVSSPGMLTSHKEKKNEWNLEVPGWNYYIGVHKRRGAKEKRCANEKVPRRITGFLIERNQSTGKYPWFFHPARSLGRIPTVKKGKEKKKGKDPQTQNWMLKIHGPTETLLSLAC